MLQKEHAEEVEKLIREKDKEICDWEEKFTALEATYNEIKSKFPNLQHLSNPEMVVKTLEDYEKQVRIVSSLLSIFIFCPSCFE